MTTVTNEPRYKHALEAMNHVHSLADGKGTVVCPRCGGSIYYEKRLRGELEWSRAKCETEECVAWLV